MAEKNEYLYKLNEVYHAATVHTKRLMKTYAEEYAYRASEEEGSQVLCRNYSFRCCKRFA